MTEVGAEKQHGNNMAVEYCRKYAIEEKLVKYTDVIYTEELLIKNPYRNHSVIYPALETHEYLLRLPIFYKL